MYFVFRVSFSSPAKTLMLFEIDLSKYFVVLLYSAREKKLSNLYDDKYLIIN